MARTQRKYKDQGPHIPFKGHPPMSYFFQQTLAPKVSASFHDGTLNLSSGRAFPTQTLRKPQTGGEGGGG